MASSDPDADTQALVTAARAGDADALDELFGRHLQALQRFVRSRAGQTVRSAECTWDLVQTACRQALPRLDLYEPQGEGSFRNWLFAFAMAKIQNRRHHLHAKKRDVRRASEFTDAPDDALSPVAQLMAREQVEQLATAMESLPPDYREVLVRTRLLGQSHREIAADLGKSEGATRVTLSRALARLSTLLDA